MVETEPTGIEVAVADRIMTIRLSRESKRNAISYDMYRRLVALLDIAEHDEDISCVLFASTGAIFTAGHDVAGFAQGLEMAYDEKPSFHFMKALVDFPKPIAAALNGNAVGIGATMLLHCDMVYGVPEARIVFPFADMGLIPEFASSLLLPRLAGHRRAMAILLNERGCDMRTAVDLGLVNEAVPREELEAHALRVLGGIAALSLDAVVMTKTLLKADERAAIHAAMRQEAESFHQLLHSPFVRNRLAAIRARISDQAISSDN